MSTFKSYFSKNNTIVAKDSVNTARNPITELFYGKEPTTSCKYTGLSGDSCGGRTGHTLDNSGKFSRFIFDLNLNDVISKVNNGCINLYYYLEVVVLPGMRVLGTTTNNMVAGLNLSLMKVMVQDHLTGIQRRH